MKSPIDKRQQMISNGVCRTTFHEHQKKVASKPIKGPLLSAAIFLSVSGAFSTRPHYDCSTQTQYYLSGGIYLLAGTEGINYTCVSGSGTCTYYTNDGITFLPCQPGVYCTSNCDPPGSRRH